jgi:hypothetical protein
MRRGEAGDSSEPSIVILVGVLVAISCFGFLLSVLRCSILGCSGRTGGFGALAGRFLG